MKRLNTGKGLRPASVTMTVMTLCFVIILVCPIYSLFSKAFLNADGSFAGFANYAEYFSTPAPVSYTHLDVYKRQGLTHGTNRADRPSFLYRFHVFSKTGKTGSGGRL